MYRIKWMIVHGLDAQQTYIADLYVKLTAIRCLCPEEFVWQTLYELSLNKSWVWRLGLGFYANILLTLFVTVVNKDLFLKSIEVADEKLVKLHQEVLLHHLKIMGDEEQEPQPDRSKAN